jgi:hypothetical protein
MSHRSPKKVFPKVFCKFISATPFSVNDAGSVVETSHYFSLCNQVSQLTYKKAGLPQNVSWQPGYLCRMKEDKTRGFPTLPYDRLGFIKSSNQHYMVLPHIALHAYVKSGVS